MNTERSRTTRCPSRPHTLGRLLLAAYGLGLTGTALLAPGQVLAQAKPAAAAPASTGAVQEITVTARKRAETMIEVPISVQTLSEKDLRAAAVTDIKELASQTGFNFSSSQGSGAQGRAFGVTTFRGLQGELNFPWENSGGVFIDGIFISGGVGSIGMTDVSRVEVLKGPQNAFFGRSTFGGAVNFITRNPSDTLKGAVNLSINQHGSNDTDATIEGPLVSGLLNARVSVGARNKAAQFRTSDGGALGEESTRFLSGTLYFTPTDDLWLRVRGHFQRDDDSTPATAYIPAAGNTSCTGKTYTGLDRSGNKVSYTPGTAYFCDGIPKFSVVGAGVFDANTVIPAGAYQAYVNNSLNDPFLAEGPAINHAGMRRDITRVSAQLGYALPKGMDLAVNLGYNEAASNSMYDLDRTKGANFFNIQTNPTKDTTLDARLSTDPKAALRGVVGASYFKSTFQLSQLDFNSGLGATAAIRNPGNYLNLRSEVPAVYGSVEYDLTKQITASLEARYQTDKIDFTSFTGVTTSNEKKSWLPRLTLRYKPNANTSAYVNLARGVQPLTVNTGYANSNADGRAYILSLFPNAANFTPQPKLDSIELGFKQRVSQNFQYAAAVYDQKWVDRLSATVIFNPSTCGTTTGTPACPFSVAGTGVTVGNQARMRGLELSIDAQVSPEFAVGAYIDYKKGTWDRFDASSQSRFGSNGVRALTGDAVAFHGNELSRVPNLTVSANGTLRKELGKGWSSYLRGDITYVGSSWETEFNFTKSDPYSRIDLRLGFETADTSLEFFVRNLANDRSWTSVARSPNLGLTPLTNFSSMGVIATAQEERAYGLRVRYTF